MRSRTRVAQCCFAVKAFTARASANAGKWQASSQDDAPKPAALASPSM